MFKEIYLDYGLHSIDMAIQYFRYHLEHKSTKKVLNAIKQLEKLQKSLSKVK